jgi:hypothetical protein
MFSLFENGITDTRYKKFIDLSELRQLVRQNPNEDMIESIRTLRQKGDDSYKALKSRLPYITPNCMVRERNLEEEKFAINFLQFSQYLYFDIDCGDVEEYKKYFIEKYNHQLSFVCISSSGGGISVLFKVRNRLTRENFESVWTWVRNNILPGEPVDKKCKNISRAMFISSDKEAYCNFENKIDVFIENETTKEIKKEGKQGKTCKDFKNTLISPFYDIPFNEVLERIITRTAVQVSNPVLDFKPVEIVEFYIPRIIKDGSKHIIYKSMIHTLVFLNPALEKEYIYRYISYINNRFAKPKMEAREFRRWFNMVYDSVKDSGEPVVSKEVQYIHFNPQCHLTKKEKSDMASMINGCKRRNNSIRRIQDAKSELEHAGQKITQKQIAKLSGLSPKTVRTHLNSSLIDIEEIVTLLNDSVPLPLPHENPGNRRA